MPFQYDHVEFYDFNPETDEMEKVCTVYLVKGKLTYEGRLADQTKREIESNKDLDSYRELGAYPVLARLEHVYKGTYCHATGVIPATAL